MKLELFTKKRSLTHWIFGNGYSLKDFNPRVVNNFPNDVRWGVNGIFRKEGIQIDYYCALDAPAWQSESEAPNEIAMDGGYWRERLERLNCKNYFTMDETKYNVKNPPDWLDTFKPLGGYGWEYDVTRGLYHGCTSVFPCIQMAVWCGARHLNFVGIDIEPGPKTHFYGNRSWSKDNERQWKSLFRDIVIPELKSLKISWCNFSPISKNIFGERG